MDEFLAASKRGKKEWQIAEKVIRGVLAAAAPGVLLKEALQELELAPSYTVLAIGKAAWTMAEAALDALGSRVKAGFIITKDGHSKGLLPPFEIIEAAHPILDQRSLNAGAKLYDLAAGLSADEHLLCLISGGGSALFEHSLLSLDELAEINRQLLASGASIEEINSIRKRLSELKGGRFAALCAPAKIQSILLSDVLGDEPGEIASGPTVVDRGSYDFALSVVERYQIQLSEEAKTLLARELPEELTNVETKLIGSVALLCRRAVEILSAEGYTCLMLSERMDCEAKELGRMLGAMATSFYQGSLAISEDLPELSKLAIICGGETTVNLKTGTTIGGAGPQQLASRIQNGIINGKDFGECSVDTLGGRNQEIALAAVSYLSDLPGALLFSLGSDGSDGPTDAAGAIVDSSSLAELLAKGLDADTLLATHNSYLALESIEAHIKTGPTGSNLNDLTVLLLEK
ncbi:MAG: DUF4147 domain-containing protein [Eubacteriales bacterium]|nr:DUF4147 domain-containing protein [Eubacteriales bacterium]